MIDGQRKENAVYVQIIKDALNERNPNSKWSAAHLAILVQKTCPLRELTKELADQIIIAKKNGEPTTALGDHVNEIVYQVYGVTEQDEIDAEERG